MKGLASSFPTAKVDQAAFLYIWAKKKNPKQ